jgi:hypothetical protein
MYELDLFSSDGSQRWTLPYSTITLNEELNKGIDGTITIAFEDFRSYAAALGTTPDGIVASAARYWKLTRDGVPMARGILLSRKVSGGSSGATSYTINFADLLAALAKRRTAEEVLYTSEDSADIAWDLINDTQADLSGYGNLGVIRGTHPTTIDRDRTLRFDNIRDTIVGMSNLKVQNGYDFDMDVSNNFNIYYPKKGQTREYIVLDAYNIINWSSDRPLQGKLTNRAHVLGKGGGADMVTASVEDTTPMATWGLCEDVVSEKGVEVVAELEDRGEKFVNLNKTPTDTIAVTIKDNAPDLSTYGVGDTIRVILEDLDYNQLLRITKRSLQIGQNGQATVNISLEATT